MIAPAIELAKDLHCNRSCAGCRGVITCACGCPTCHQAFVADTARRTHAYVAGTMRDLDAAIELEKNDARAERQARLLGLSEDMLGALLDLRSSYGPLRDLDGEDAEVWHRIEALIARAENHRPR